MKQHVWFITGCSTGIGRLLAEQALAAGHLVAATARDMAHLAPLQALPQAANLLPVQLDVNDPAQIAAAVQAAIDRFGRISVLMNNAGYGLQGTAEETPIDMVRHQMETNFFGLVALTQAVLPHMRAAGEGYVFNVASIAGLRGSPGLTYYNASKFAVVGFSEALAQEVKPFGIRVAVVEPGPYRTDWAGRSIRRAPAVTDPASPYHAINEKIDRYLTGVSGKQPGDPAQICSVLLDAVQHEQIPMHLLFGDEAIQIWNTELDRLANRDFFRPIPHSQITL